MPELGPGFNLFRVLPLAQILHFGRRQTIVHIAVFTGGAATAMALPTLDTDQPSVAL